MSGRRPPKPPRLPCSPRSPRGSRQRSGPEHRRQGRQNRDRDNGGGRVADASVLDVNNLVAALPQAPQDEAEPDSAEPAPPTLQRENTNPRGTERPRFELPQPTEDCNLRAKQAAAPDETTNQPAGEASSIRPSGGGKPNSSTLSRFLHPRPSRKPHPIPFSVPETYSIPPHPRDVGTVSHVNTCPVCQKYTVTELDRSAVPVLGCSIDETLRSRFHCGLCLEVFDIGTPLFDPRGIRGVSMFKGEEVFQPPVPPLANYPCPRCWKNTHVSFQCMTSYLREESNVPCEPECPADRLFPSSWEEPEEEEPEEEKPDEEKPEEMSETRNVVRTVLGLF